MSRRTARKRVILLVDERLLPDGNLEDFSERQRELRKTEYDVKDALEAIGNEVIAIGVSDNVAPIRGAIDAHRPHIAFNLVEEFDGRGELDQHVVSFLELCRQPYTGCNPRGLTLARDKALTKKILAYHGIKVPEYFLAPMKRKFGIPEKLAYPLFVKSLTEEGSTGISQASVVHDEEKLRERVDYIHRTTNSTALIEQFIDGREIYVGVMGNNRTTVLPPWELTMRHRNDDTPLVAGDRAKWDPEYQRKVGLETGPADLEPSVAKAIVDLSKQIYRHLGLSGYARLDFRVTPGGEPYLLEANPNPQISSDEDFARSAAHAGLSYEELIGKLVAFGRQYLRAQFVE